MTAIANPIFGPMGALPRAREPAELTPEDLLEIPDDGRRLELVDGQLVEKPMSDLAHLVADNCKNEFVLWSMHGGGGRSFVGAPFRCFPHAPSMIRIPDVAWLSPARLAGYRWNQSFVRLVPDVAVEVVSPSDKVYDLDRKIADFLRVGVRRVWVINPEQQTVRVHRAPGDVSELLSNAEIYDEEVLPGFRIAVAALFVGPSEEQPALSTTA